MKLIRVAWFNIRKRKGAAFSLALLVFLSSLFLCIGVNIAKESGQMYGRNQEAFGEADSAYVIDQKVYKKEYQDFLEQDKRVKKLETSYGIIMGSEDSKVLFDEGETLVSSLFLNMDQETGMQKIHIAEELKESEKEATQGRAIYVPKSQKSFPLNLGDTLTFVNKGERYEYTVAGFIDTTSFGISNIGTYKYYLSDEDWEELSNEIGVSYLFSVQLENKGDSEALDVDLRELMRQKADSRSDDSIENAYFYELADDTYNFMGSILSAVLMGFSMVIALVALIAVRFRVINNMEENLVQIGTLGALGYVGREIRWIYALEYVLTSLAGGLLGFLVSYAAIPVVGSMIGDMAGLSWYSGSHFGRNLMVLVGLLLLVLFLCYMAAGRIHRYPPVTALSKGIQAHNFKKNHFPLEKCKGNLQVWLAAKEVFGLIRQNVTVFICILTVTFAAMLGIYLYVTFGCDMTTLKKVGGWEWTDISITLKNTADAGQIREEILEMDGVRKVGMEKQIQVYAEDTTVFMTAFSDCLALESMNAFEGRLPEYQNEVMVTGVLAERLGKRVGDSIPLEYNGYSADYVICGLNQTFSNAGNMVEVTREGMERIHPYGKLDILDIYLEKGVSVDKMIGQLSNRYGVSAESMAGEQENGKENVSKEEQIKQKADEKIAKLLRAYGVDSVDYSIMVDGSIISGNSRRYVIDNIMDFKKVMGNQLSGIAAPFKAAMILVLICTALIIALLFGLIIKTLVSRKKMEFGIMKGLGYSTGQLMVQIACSIMPSVLVGIVAGIVLNHFFIGDLTSLMMRGIGISRMEYMISPWILLLAGALLACYAFLAAMFFALRVRKISVYELLTD